jgi:Cu(I)/Ag(I) efflux system membrane fusion protein
LTIGRDRFARGFAGGGYWLGGKGGAPTVPIGNTGGSDRPPSRPKKKAKLLYYRNPMGLARHLADAQERPDGHGLHPVYEGEEEEEANRRPPTRSGSAPRRYRNSGCSTEAASCASLDKIVRAAGRIEPDERRTYAISPKFEGYVERLHVNVTGQPVGQGAALFEVYSPELVSAQREYAIAAQGVDSLNEAGGEAQAGMRQLADRA